MIVYVIWEVYFALPPPRPSVHNIWFFCYWNLWHELAVCSKCFQYWLSDVNKPDFCIKSHKKKSLRIMSRDLVFLMLFLGYLMKLINCRSYYMRGLKMIGINGCKKKQLRLSLKYSTISWFAYSSDFKIVFWNTLEMYWQAIIYHL